MSFSLGVREYEGKQYITIEDELVDIVHYDDHLVMRNKAIVELLAISPDYAFKLLKRYRLVIQEVERDFLKVRDYNSFYALEQFEGTANLRGIVVKRSAWVDEAIVTSNFTNGLESEIWARGFIISQIEDALMAVVDDKQLQPVSIFVEDDVIDELPDNNTSETESIPWKDWYKVVETGRLIIKPSPLVAKSEQDDHEFFQFLNDAGKSIFEPARKYFKGARPNDVFAVFFAMVELNLIVDNKKNLFKMTRRAVAEALGRAFDISLSTQIVGHNIHLYEGRSEKHLEKINDAKKVLTQLLLEKKV